MVFAHFTYHFIGRRASFWPISGWNFWPTMVRNTYAVGIRNSYGTIAWGDWERCKVMLTIDFDNDYIKVYSDKEQNYVIIDTSDPYRDKSGGSNIDCTAIDEEGIECTVRLRVQRDGTAQLYAFYNDVAWVYSGLERV